MIPLGVFSSGSSSLTWLNYSTTGSNYPQDVVTDSAQNTLFAIYTVATLGLGLIKCDKYGNILWQKTLGQAPNGESGYGVGTDSSNNIYLTGLTDVESTAQSVVAKYNSAGTLQWQRFLDITGRPNKKSVTDAAGNTYLIGYYGTPKRICVAKYNSSGVIQWQKFLYSGNQDTPYGIQIDSTYVYVTSSAVDNGVPGRRAHLAKLDFAGAIQWQKWFSIDPGLYQEVAVDTSGNVFMAIMKNITGTDDVVLVKYNSSGTLQWQRSLSSASTDNVKGLTTDSSGNVYVATDTVVAKYDSTGAIQWQRSLASSAGAVAILSLTTVGTNLIIASTVNNRFFSAKLPLDGTKTGTFYIFATSFTWAASSLTDASTSQYDATAGLSTGDSTQTDSAGTFTAGVGTNQFVVAPV